MTDVAVGDNLSHSYCSICEKSDAEEGIEIIVCTSGNLICKVCRRLSRDKPPEVVLDHIS